MMRRYTHIGAMVECVDEHGNPAGDWVRYEDHMREIDALKHDIERLLKINSALLNPNPIVRRLGLGCGEVMPEALNVGGVQSPHCNSAYPDISVSAGKKPR